MGVRAHSSPDAKESCVPTPLPFFSIMHENSIASHPFLIVHLKLTFVIQRYTIILFIFRGKLDYCKFVTSYILHAIN